MRGDLAREAEREILDLLWRARRPVGIEAIAATLALDLEEVWAVHEPFLLRAGLVRRTPLGRELTEKGTKMLSEGSRSSGPIMPTLYRELTPS